MNVINLLDNEVVLSLDNEVAAMTNPQEALDHYTRLEEITIAESLLNDEIRCDGDHDGECSVLATYWVSYCAESIPLCESYGLRVAAAIESRSFTCHDCRRKAEDCWTITPWG